MNFHEVEFAFCPSGHATPIRLPMPPGLTMTPQLIQMENETLFVACMHCPHVFPTKNSSLVPHGSDAEFLDENSAGQYQRNYVSIPCEEEGCELRVSVLAVRMRDITAEAIEAESANWKADEVECPDGHKFSLPVRLWM